MTSPRPNPPTFQELILRLESFWAEHGCVLQQPFDLELGAGTMSPETFLRVLGPQPYKVAYVQPSRRPADGRYGENPNRLYKHMQLQVILKPPPDNVQELYLNSIFQQCGGVDLFPISAELTYGLERIAAFLEDVDSIYDVVWARDPETGRATKYGEVRLADELQMSVYNFEMADVASAWKRFELCEAECKALLEQYAEIKNRAKASENPREHGHSGSVVEKRRFPLLGAYELCLRCSHLFNILDARGAISVTERVGVMARVRALAVGIAKAWVDQQSTEASPKEEPEAVGKQRKSAKLAPVGS
jgi:glycyl-tRNA synthetase alpha chain